MSNELHVGLKVDGPRVHAQATAFDPWLYELASKVASARLRRRAGPRVTSLGSQTGGFVFFVDFLLRAELAKLRGGRLLELT